jgi:Skp family chaperone for outer membrane proteins
VKYFRITAVVWLLGLMAVTAFAQGGTGRETGPTPSPKAPPRKTTPAPKRSAASNEAPAPAPAPVVPKIVVFDSGAFSDEQTGITRLINAVRMVNAEFKPRRDELEELQRKLKQAERELGNPGGLNAAQLQAKTDQYERMKREHNYKLSDTDAMYAVRRREVLAPIQQEIASALAIFNQKAGIARAIDSANYSGVAQVDGALDVTRTFIQAYNNGTQPTFTLPAPKVGVFRSDAFDTGLARIAQIRKSVDLEFGCEKSRKPNESDDDFRLRQESVKTNYDRYLKARLRPILEDVSKAISAFATARGFNLVIDVSKGIPEGVQSDNLADFSAAFIADYNQRNP